MTTLHTDVVLPETIVPEVTEHHDEHTEELHQWRNVHVGETRYNAKGYGVMGDGSANDVAAGQALIDAIKSRGGGVMYLPQGVYKMGVDGSGVGAGAWYMCDNLTIEGDGPGLTVIQAPDDPNTSSIDALIWNDGRRVETGGTGLGNTNIHLRNLTVDGAKGAETDYGANRQLVYLDYVDDFTIENVHARNAITDAVVLSFCRRGTVEKSWCYDNLKSGFYSAGSDNIDYVGCHGYGNGSLGIGSTFVLALAWWNTITGCSASGDVGPSLGMSRDTQHCAIVGNVLHGIDTLGETIAGPSPFYADHPGRGATYNPATIFGIYNCLFASNVIRGDGGLASPGIRLLQSDGNSLLDNIVRYCNRGGIQINSGNRNKVSRNKLQQWGMANVAGQTAAISITDGGAFTSSKNVVDDNEMWDEGVAGAYGITVSSGGGGGITLNRVLRNIVEATNRYFFGASMVALLDADGTGSPNSTGLYCGPGSQWKRSDGGAGTSLYVKESASSADTGFAGK